MISVLDSLIPNKDRIAGNYYPVTNRVRIQDSKKFFTIFTDRTHGGTSLEKGHLELMVQRRIRNPLEARSIFERGQFQTGNLDTRILLRDSDLGFRFMSVDRLRDLWIHEQGL